MFRTKRAFFFILTALVAAEILVLFCTRHLPGLLPLAAVLNWLGLLVLGTDETTETFGYWGEPVLFFLLSVPLLAAYAALLSLVFFRGKRP